MVHYGLCFLLFVSSFRLLVADTCFTEVITKQGYIVDIKASLDNGAQLKGGLRSVSGEECLNRCCEYDECDLALYRTEGSDQGHNCYLVACLQPANCVLASHYQFTSFLLDRDVYTEDQGDLKEVNTNDNDTHTSGREHSIVDTSSPGDSSVNNNITLPTSPEEYHDNSTEATATITHASNSTDNTTAKHGEEQTKINSIPVSTTATPPVTTDVTSVNNATAPDTHDQKDITVTKECRPGEKGCHDNDNEVGLIVIGALGGVAFIAMFLVSVLAIRKILDNRRQKQFRNVDYLINGMYS